VRLRSFILIFVLGLTIPLFGITPASATTTAEGRALRLLNYAREQRGLRRLVRTDTLDAYAERQAERMRAAGELFHSNLSKVPKPWLFVGENVGYAGSVRRLHRGLMRSPSHRENILRPRFDHVGIGIVRTASGRVYEAQVFVDR
jgi:uncharacterized protein YkwD